MGTNNANYWGTDCIILSRVSTLKQDYLPQTNDLLNYAKSLGYKNCHEISTKESGFKVFEAKEGFRQVVDYIKDNPTCRTIFITELSRLGRNRKIITDIEYFLKDQKIQLIVKDNNLKLFDNYGNIIPSNQLMFSIFSSLAESEMNTKKERFLRAKKDLYRQGLAVGGKTLFGYTRVNDEVAKRSKYIINVKESKEIKKVYDWYLNGINGDVKKSSMLNIAKEAIKQGLSPYFHSKRNVNKCLKEEAYTGYKVNKNRHKNPEYWEYKNLEAAKYIDSEQMEISYPIIISRELFDNVQNRILANNTTVDKATKHTTILSKLVVCPDCGHYYRGDYIVKNGYIKHNYRCSYSKGINPCKDGYNISMLLLDSVIWSFCKNNVTDLVQHITDYYSNVDVNEFYEIIENLEKKIIDYESEIDTENIIFRTNIKRTNDKNKLTNEYTDRINLLNNKIDVLRTEIENQKRAINDYEENKNKNLQQEISSKIGEIELSKNEIQKYIRALIKRIEPLFVSRKYTVIKVVSVENLGYSINGEMGKDGLPKLKENKADIEYYIIINKNNVNNISAKIVENKDVIFNRSNGLFILNNNEFTLDNIFGIDVNKWDILEEPFLSLNKKMREEMEVNTLYFSVKDLELKKFENDLYSND